MSWWCRLISCTSPVTLCLRSAPEPFISQGHRRRCHFSHFLRLFLTDTFRCGRHPARRAPARRLGGLAGPGVPGTGGVRGVRVPQRQGLPLPRGEQLHLPGREQHLPLELTWKSAPPVDARHGSAGVPAHSLVGKDVLLFRGSAVLTSYLAFLTDWGDS